MLKKMSQMIMSFLVITLAILSNANSQIGQPQFTIKAESGKEFDKSCLIGNFTIANGSISDCLELCLENCSCQSFQICQNTQCQLCSSNKEDNSSLLHEKNDCVYAMYEMRHLTETFQKMDDQYSGMSCLLKYNCCLQSDLCPKNKICKPINNIKQPWKRFTCECPDGENCDEPFTSCRGHYSNGSRESGIYKLIRYPNRSNKNPELYDVYCRFDSDVAWTLVQSYSFAMYKSNDKFRKALSKNEQVNKDELKWSEYRLSKNRMISIAKDTVRLAFTCDYNKKHDDFQNLDYVVIPLPQYNTRKGKNKTINVVKLVGKKNVTAVRGKIGEVELDNCKIRLYQKENGTETGALHIDIDVTRECNFTLPINDNCTANDWEKFNYFGNYSYNGNKCLDMEHQCVKNENSTTQLWFGN